MDKLKRELRIALIEPDKTNAKQIKTLFEKQIEIKYVELFHDKEDLLSAINSDRVNTLVINIFTYGVSEGVEMIKEVLPLKDKTIPVCIVGTDAEIKSFDGSLYDFKNFKDFCKIIIDVSTQDLNENIYRISKGLLRCKVEKILKKQKKDIETDKQITDKEKLEKLEEIAEQSLEIISAQGKEINEKEGKCPVSGLNLTDLTKIIQDTLDKTSKSIALYKWVNVGIIAVGLILVLGSAIYAVVEDKDMATAMAFGGLGLAGIIASLVTNPTNSIGKTAGQLIQIQIGYFGFLEQLELLNHENKSIGDLEKSKQLDSITNSHLKTLCKCFDSPKKENEEE